jgi:hypothetical protein
MTETLHVNLSSIKGFNEILQDDINEINNSSYNILKLNKLECRTENNQRYKVITYDKKVLNHDLYDSYGLCRSVIVNSQNHVVSFAPPKSLQADTFLNLYPVPNEDIVAQEFVEGTMINVFFDHTIGLSGGWEIATKNIVGATCGFYKQESKSTAPNQTFRTMFLEAAKENNLYLESLNRNLCYSFVLQHPNNRIVVPIKKPQLYLVAIYFIDNTDSSNIKVYISDLQHDNKDYWVTTSIKFPEIYKFNDYSELINTYASMNSSYDKMGVVLYNTKTGHRTKIRNPVYEEVRHLKGNQPKLQFQYLTLRKDGKINNYLKKFPENKKDFSLFRDQVHLFTNTLFSNYISCYIKKEKPLKDYMPQYKSHMFTIHEKYKNELKPQNLFVTNQIVIDYVNNLSPTLLMHCLNYNYKNLN